MGEQTAPRRASMDKGQWMRIARGLIGLFFLACLLFQPAWAVIRPHPRIWLTSESLQKLQAAAAAGHPAWVALKAAIDRYMPACNPASSLAPLIPHSYALAYQITKNRDYGYCAVNLAKQQMERYSPGGPTGCTPRCPYQSMNDFRNLAWIPAVVFDWCYELLTAEDKRLFVDTLTTAVRYQALNPYLFSKGGGPGGNLMAGQISRTGIIGLALYGDNPSDDPARERNAELSAAAHWFNNEVKPWLGEGFGVGGAMSEGPEYASQVHQYYTEWFDAVLTATGEDYYEKIPSYVSDAVLFTLHSTSPQASGAYCGQGLPSYAPLPWGDLQQGSQLVFLHSHRMYMLRLANYLGSQELGRYSRFWLNHVHPGSKCGRTELHHLIWNFLYSPSELPEQDYRGALPTEYLAKGMGRVVSRSDWSPDATWVGFFAGQQLQDHIHADANSFVLYRKGTWLTHDEIGWGLEYAPTELHNTLLLGGKGSVIFKSDGNAALTRYETDPGGRYVYATGDATWAYRSSILRGDWQNTEQFVREFVYLKPDYIVTFDRVRNRVPAASQYGVQFLSEPDLADGYIRAKQGSQVVFLTTVLPENPQVKLLHQKELSEVVINNSLYKTGGKFKNWRTEISSGLALESEQLLHVIQAADDGVEPSRAMAVRDTALVAVHILDPVENAVVGFSAGAYGEDIPVPLSYTFQPSGAVSLHMIANLPAQNTLMVSAAGEEGGKVRVRIVPEGEETGTPLTTSPQGVLLFRLSPGDTSQGQAAIVAGLPPPRTASPAARLGRLGQAGKRRASSHR